MNGATREVEMSFLRRLAVCYKSIIDQFFLLDGLGFIIAKLYAAMYRQNVNYVSYDIRLLR